MNTLQVALAQIAPVWLNRQKTLDKIKDAMLEAAKEKAQLVVFGEGLLPGYPFWLGLTDGAKWDLKINKVLHFKLQVKAPTEATQGKAEHKTALSESRKMLKIKEIKEFRR